MSHGVRTAADAAATTSAGVREGWFDRPMRWAQLTLVENDPGRYDPQLWLDYFRLGGAGARPLPAAA